MKRSVVSPLFVLLVSALLCGCPPTSEGHLGSPFQQHPPSGGLLKSVDSAIAAALQDKSRADGFFKEGDFTTAQVFYHQGLSQAAKAFNWSQQFETNREWFSRELYPQLRNVIMFMPDMEKRLAQIDKGQLANPVKYRSASRRLAFWRITMNLPASPTDIELSQEECGANWWERNSQVRRPALVQSREEAWLAVKERMRLLDLYLKGKGPRPPHVHEIVKELRRQGKIGPAPEVSTGGN